MARAPTQGHPLQSQPARRDRQPPPHEGRQARAAEERQAAAGAAERDALAALDALPPRLDTTLVFPAPRGGYLYVHNWRNRDWYPALDAAGLAKRGPYALRHTFASLAIRAGIDPFALSRLMGTSLEMIDQHYGHLLPGADEAALRTLATFRSTESGLKKDSEPSQP